MADNQYASLIFNNKASADLGILIQYPFQVVHPQIDGDPTHIEGRSGDFLPDVNSYQNVTETFNVIVNRSPNLSQADWQSDTGVTLCRTASPCRLSPPRSWPLVHCLKSLWPWHRLSYTCPWR